MGTAISPAACGLARQRLGAPGRRCGRPTPRSPPSSGGRRSGHHSPEEGAPGWRPVRPGDRAGEVAMPARAYGCPEAGDFRRLLAQRAQPRRHSRPEHALLITERADAEQPHRALAKISRITAHELRRGRQPFPAVDGAAKYSRVVPVGIWDVTHRPHVHSSPAPLQPVSNPLRHALRRTVRTRVSDQHDQRHHLRLSPFTIQGLQPRVPATRAKGPRRSRLIPPKSCTTTTPGHGI